MSSLIDVGSTEALSRFVQDFDLAALAEGLGEELSAELLGPYREQATFDRSGLTSILGAAASRGVARFVSCAAIEPPVDDGTAAVIAVVRDALSLICVDPDSADAAQRAQMATRGVHLLGQLVGRWDAPR